MRVLGVDGCPAGWVGVVAELPGSGSPGPARLEALVCAGVAELVDRAGAVDVVGVDMPIGLLETAFRGVDALARARLGPKRSSLFLIPPRPVLEQADFAEAVALSRTLTGAGVSRQAHGLRSKIFELERFVAGATVPVVEVHPELSFAEMSGGTKLSSKRTWRGFWQRVRLLESVGMRLSGQLEELAGAVAPDDVTDAAAAAWTAGRVAVGVAGRLEVPGESPIAIWV